MSDVVVHGLQRRVKELEEGMRSKKALESKCRNLERELESLKKTATNDTDPFACVVCLERTTDVLPCYHRCCFQCISAVLWEETKDQKEPKCRCPVCRTPFVTDMRGVELVSIDLHPRKDVKFEVAFKTEQIDLMTSYIVRLSDWARNNMKEKGTTCVRTFAPHSAPSSPRDRSSNIGP